jgi:hypothetical protein
MTDQFDLTYYAIYKTEEMTPPAVGLFTNEVSKVPIRGVVWAPDFRAWKFAPQFVANWLFDDRLQDRRARVSRAEAEQIARERLGVDLPSEEELIRISDEGEKIRNRES